MASDAKKVFQFRSWCNRKKGEPIEYLVLWEGYPDEGATWEPYENIKGTAEEALAAYRAKNPSGK